MKRNAFSLVELIFVIVLMGVLTGIGFYMSQPSYTKKDAQYTLLKLKEARYRAIGFETADGSCSEGGWIKFEEISLENDSTNTKHDIKSAITYDTSILTNINKTICFDSLGRPHDGNRSDFTAPLLSSDLTITLSKSGDKDTNITLYCGTGYAIIPCNN